MFLLAVIPYVAHAEPPMWQAMCTEWMNHGTRVYDGSCRVNFRQPDAGSAEMLIDMDRRPVIEMAVGPDRCTMDGKPCIRVKAGRFDGVRYHSQDGHTVEFTKAPE